MYCIFTCIWVIYGVNVPNYSIEHLGYIHLYSYWNDVIFTSCRCVWEQFAACFPTLLQHECMLCVDRENCNILQIPCENLYHSFQMLQNRNEKRITGKESPNDSPPLSFPASCVLRLHRKITQIQLDQNALKDFLIPPIHRSQKKNRTSCMSFEVPAMPWILDGVLRATSVFFCAHGGLGASQRHELGLAVGAVHDAHPRPLGTTAYPVAFWTAPGVAGS